MEREETIQLLMVIQAAFPNYKPQDKSVTVNIWSTMLKDYKYDEVMQSLQRYIATDVSGFAPGIGAIIQGIAREKKQFLGELEAWSTVSKALRNGYYGAEEEFQKLDPLVQKAVGNPYNLRNWSQTDIESVENVIQSNFIKTYRTLVERAEKEESIPPAFRVGMKEQNLIGAQNG